MNANTHLRWNDQLLQEYSNVVWMKKTHKCKYIPSHVFVHCYRTPHTPLGDSGKPVFHASHLLRALHVKWHSISNVALRPPYGCRKCFHTRVQFHKFLSSAVIDVFLFTCCFDKPKPTFIMTNSHPQKNLSDWLFWDHFHRQEGLELKTFID